MARELLIDCVKVMHTRQRSLLFVAAALLLCRTTVGATREPLEAPPKDGYIVQMSSQAAVSLAGHVEKLPGDMGFYVVRDLRKGELAPVADAVFPNIRCRTSSPDDPLLRYQAHLVAQRVERGWEIQPRADGVIVAVLDTGVAYERWSDQTGDFYLSSDLAGTAFVPGFDFVNWDTHPNDDNHHGTFVAGIVAQTTGNTLGTAGFAPGASIMPVKVLDAQGTGTLAQVICGIVYAADNDADVVLMSFAFAPGADPGLPLELALAYARSKGAILVAASGNDGLPSVSYPAASPSCLAVGAARTATEGVVVRTSYSNWGTALDLLAFGGDAADRNLDGQPDAPLAQSFALREPAQEDYHFIAGTSAAAASAAGCLALMIAAGDSPERALDHILASAIDIEDAGFDTATGFGVMNPEGAIALAKAGADPLLPVYGKDVKLTLQFAGPRKARLRADITVWNADGSPAGGVRVYQRFLGVFKGACGDQATTPQGKCKFQTGWLDTSSLPPWWWIPGVGYGMALDRVVDSGHSYDPLNVAPNDDFSGANVIIDQPIRDQ